MSDQFLKAMKRAGKVRTNEPMSKHTTFKIGGPARYFVTVDTVDHLIQLLLQLRGGGVDYMILGGGSNMLVSDTGYDGVVVDIQSKDIRVEDDVVIADAGAMTVDVARFAADNGLTGFEWGVGVPGTIGGAVRGNAGAMGKEMKDDVYQVEVYRDGEVHTLTNEQCAFGYRDSKFKENNDIILVVHLKLTKDLAYEPKNMMEKMLGHLQYRNNTQPQGHASTGCIFKNHILTSESDVKKEAFTDHEKLSQFLETGIIPAGYLVEEAGLKGRQQGNAQISSVHGNFIVNLGGATATDVLYLIDLVKQTVYTNYGISLEEEIKIVR